MNAENETIFYQLGQKVLFHLLLLFSLCIVYANSNNNIDRQGNFL